MKEKNPISIIFGANVKYLRLSRGLTQEHLAELSNCHPNYIGAVERGERNITIIKVANIANALNCRISDLLEGI
ncbi:MAG: helix-turn-helix transcriptional regulator [Chlorobium sp.]|nr:helix-turn-helix transcriptional regulator [Chlorobium sp.]